MPPSNPEIKYTFLNYHPSPELGELGNRMTIALVAFTSRCARLWIVKGRLDSICDFGDSQDRNRIIEFLVEFDRGLASCLSPEIAIRSIDADLEKAVGIVRFTEIRSMSAASIEKMPTALGVDVEKCRFAAQELQACNLDM